MGSLAPPGNAMWSSITRPPLDASPRLVAVDAPRRGEAWNRLVGNNAVDLPLPPRRSVPLDLMWATLDESGGIRETVLCVPRAGRLGLLFVTPPRRRGRIAALVALLEHVGRSLRDEALDMAQTLLPPSQRLTRRALLDGGFHELATLLDLHRALEPVDAAWMAPLPQGVTLHAYREARRAELLSILDATYEGTLDCPRLHGMRRTADILAGLRGSNGWVPGLWTMLHLDGAPSGTVLLTPSHEPGTVELAYLGLSPVARGRGLGRVLLSHGLSLASRRGFRSVRLAVDVNNDPARKLYRHFGFEPRRRRLAFVMDVRAPGRAIGGSPVAGVVHDSSTTTRLDGG